MARVHQIIPITMPSGATISPTIDLRGAEGGVMIFPLENSSRVNITFQDIFTKSPVMNAVGNTKAMYNSVWSGAYELWPALCAVGRLQAVFNTCPTKDNTILFAITRST